MKRFQCPRHWTIQQRLDHYSIPEPNSGCLLWLGFVDRDGYGRAKINRKPRQAHQVSWEVANKRPWPVGKMGCHKCDVPTCIEPTHIYPGTHRQNMDDMLARGRKRRGESHWMSKLTTSDVLQIREMGGTHDSIAALYGVSQGVVTRIKNRESWRHI